MYTANSKIIIACKKHAVSNKPPRKVQTFSISLLPQISPPSNKPPSKFSKLTISPLGRNRGFTVSIFWGSLYEKLKHIRAIDWKPLYLWKNAWRYLDIVWNNQEETSLCWLNPLCESLRYNRKHSPSIIRGKGHNMVWSHKYPKFLLPFQKSKRKG